MAVLCPAAGLSLVVARRGGGHSPAGARGLTCFRCGARALGMWARSCGAQAQCPQGTWSPLGTRIKPASPALGGRLVTTG